MATYVILSYFHQDAFDDPEDLQAYAQTVADRISDDCPDVDWQESYATTGAVDVIDIVESDDLKQVQKAALIIRALGYADTEILAAEPWNEFIDQLA